MKRSCITTTLRLACVAVALASAYIAGAMSVALMTERVSKEVELADNLLRFRRDSGIRIRNHARRILRYKLSEADFERNMLDLRARKMPNMRERSLPPLPADRVKVLRDRFWKSFDRPAPQPHASVSVR